MSWRRTVRVLERDRDLYAGPGAGRAGDHEAASERLHPLAHAVQPPSRRDLRINPAAIVADADPQRATVLGLVKLDGDPRCARVTQRIGQAFLNTAVGRQVD